VIKRTPFQIQKAVIFALLMRELKTRFGGHWAGVVWLFGEPLLKLAVLTWVFVYLRGRSTQNGYPYEIYLLVALQPFSLFSSLWTQLMNGIKSNAGLYGYKQVKPLDALIARTLLEMALASMVFIIGFTLMWRFRSGPTWPQDFLEYSSVVLCFVALGFGFGLVCSVVLRFFPRITLLVSLLNMPLQILSGAVFPIRSFPKDFLNILMYNPLAHLVELARQAFLPGYQVIQGVSFYYPLLWVLCSWTLGLSLYWFWRNLLSTAK
jgi:capsular polysaccharide transport system permease protein